MTDTTITCYLNTTYNGDLTVNWSVEYEATLWPETVTVDNMSVALAGSGVGQEFYAFLEPDLGESGVPYIAGATLELGIQGPHADTAVEVRDSTGTGVGSVTAGSGFNLILWTVAADLYSPGDGDWFHLIDGDGNTSNMFFVRWMEPVVFGGEVEPPTGVHVTTVHVESDGAYVIYDVGGAAQTVQIIGHDFVTGCTIEDSGGAVSPTPTFVSSTELTWSVAADDFTSGTNHSYHVVNPDLAVSNDFTLHWVDEIPDVPPFEGDTLGLTFGAISMPLEQVQGVSDGWISDQADALADLGVGWQRGDYPASMTNPSPGTYDFDDADRWVIAALDRGIKPLPILYQLPSWMNGSGNDKTPPLDNTDYATWCAAACDHLWGLGVRAVELWNEQNLAGFWNSPSNSDADTRQRYVTMIQEAYPAIKAVTPDMVVVSGGLSTADSCWNDTNSPNPPGHGALSTIQRYGELGLFDYIDALGWHPYLDDDRPCEDVGGWPAWNLGSVQAVLDILDTFAPGRNLKIWTTETGCPRSATGGSESTQADVGQDAYAAYLDGGCLETVRDRLGPFFWFCVADRTTGNGREDSFGFMDSSLTTKHTIYDQMQTFWATTSPSMLMAGAVSSAPRSSPRRFRNGVTNESRTQGRDRGARYDVPSGVPDVDAQRRPGRRGRPGDGRPHHGGQPGRSGARRLTPLNGSVQIRTGQGLWSDPVLKMKADALVQMAEQQTPLGVRAAYEYDYAFVTADDGTVSGGPLVVEIDSFINDEGGTVLLTLDADETWILPDGTGQWDVTLQQQSGDWVRLLEGQFSAIPTVSGADIPYPPTTGYGVTVPYGGSES